MENINDNTLESIELHSSAPSERSYLSLGVSFYSAVINARRADELELVLDAIAEYGNMTIAYGEKTGRVPESIVVDLSESVLMKLDSIKQNCQDTEWTIYAAQFKDMLLNASQNLGINI